jgi:hypothetical protein
VTKYHTPPTEAEQEEFLEQIALGKTRQEAAEAVGCTATQFRTYINGQSEASLAFAKRYVATLEEAGNAPSPFAGQIRELEGVQLAHRLFDEYLMRALDQEKGKSGASNRMLYNLSLLSVDSFKPLLEARTRHIHEGMVGIYAMPQIDTSKWTIEQQEEFLKLDARRSELIALAQPEGQKALTQAAPAADEIDEADIVDAVAVEV